MKKIRVLITAGPTREYIDPIRYITNESSGYLGLLLAREAVKAGCAVTLISGNPLLPEVPRAHMQYIVTAEELYAAVHKTIGAVDIVFMTSAVCDFAPIKTGMQKIKRGRHARGMTLRLKQNKDILKSIGAPRVKRDKTLVGFCIETNDVIRNAQEKVRTKNLDLIVANEYSKTNVPFGTNRMSPVVIGRDRSVERFTKVSKVQFARALVRRVMAFHRERQKSLQ